MMKTYSIYDAKAKLSELIRLVRAHGPVIITERGKPVVQVSPISIASEGVDSRLDELEKLGLLMNSKLSHKSFKPLATRRGVVKRFLESRD